MVNLLAKTGWLKTNIYLTCAICLWLAALSPIGKLGKGITLTLSMCHAVSLVKNSRELIHREAVALAQQAMHDELTQTEMALATHQQETELEHLYGVNDGTYPAEVVEDLRKSLETLVQEVQPNSTSGLPTSEHTKSLYLAVKSLLEAGKSETFVIESVLHKKGRSFDEGKAQLQQLLQLGLEQEW